MRRQVRTSEGERGPHLELLNDGLRRFEHHIGQESLPNWSFDVGVVSFGPEVTVDQPVAPVEKWDSPTLESGGYAPLGEAIERGIDLLEECKAEYKESGFPYKYPLFGLLTRSRPTDMTEGDSMWDCVQKQIVLGTNEAHFELVGACVGDGAVDTLCELTVLVDSPILQVVLAEGGYEEYFRLLAELAGTVTRQDPTGVGSRLHRGDVKREYNGLHPVK